MKTELKIVVAHPGKQHSYRLASALKKRGILYKYCTTLYDKEGSYLINVLKKMRFFNVASLIKKKHNPDLLDNDVVLFNSLFGVLEALLARIDKTQIFYYAVQHHNAKSFGKKVAKLAISSKADAVICYDSNSFECFRFLKEKEPGIVRIMDTSHCARPYEKILIEEEVKKSGNDELRKENSYLWNKTYLRHMLQEIEDTDYFLSPSLFINTSLSYCGVLPNQIVTVPYGCNTAVSRHEYNSQGPLKLLFVGNVNYNKGTTYLFEAIKRFTEHEVILTVVGMYNSSKDYIKEALENSDIRFTGKLSFDEVSALYNESDVLIVDSFAEGMAQVGLEAMNCGLPIVCSTHSGVNDVVVNKESGLVINPGSVEELVNAISWFETNREEIKNMGLKAQNTAKKYTWQKYESDICAGIISVLDSANHV